MSEPEAPRAKADPATLALRAPPRPVTRLSRRVLVGVAAVACFAIFGATFYALQKGSWFQRPAPELYNTENKPHADGLAALPKSYADIPHPPPTLGPPLPGDLGKPIVRAERDAGLREPAAPVTSFRPSQEDEAARARRLQRLREAEQAAVSKVFFPTSAKPAAAAAVAPAAARGGGEGSPANRERTTPPLDPDTAQNLQDRKLGFVNQRTSTAIYSPQQLQTPRSPYQLMAGTIIPASLVTGINSDLPGEIIGQVSENVYDTVSGRYLLIPQGTRLIGKYDSIVAYGQERVLLIWTRLILPDGSSIILDNLPGTDTQGYAGLEDGVDYHTWRLIKGVAFSTLLGVSSELAADSGTRDENRIIVGARDSADTATNQVGQRITQKNLAIQPTLTIRPGFPLRVIVNRDIVLRPYQG
jgi:type IV secretory pathway VirB10-like protein